MKHAIPQIHVSLKYILNPDFFSEARMNHLVQEILLITRL